MSAKQALLVWSQLIAATQLPEAVRGAEFSRIYADHAITFGKQQVFTNKLNELAKLRIV